MQNSFRAANWSTVGATSALHYSGSSLNRSTGWVHAPTSGHSRVADVSWTRLTVQVSQRCRATSKVEVECPLEAAFFGPDIGSMTIATYGLVDDEEIELDAAALVLSELDHPGADLAPYIEVLRQIDGRLRELSSGAVASNDQARLLASVLHGEFSFTGNMETYDARLMAISSA